jgi:hypothetical protein
LNGRTNDAWVYCTKCAGNGRTGDKVERRPKDEIEKTQWDNWTCNKCRNKVIGLTLPNFIKTRISVTATEDEDRSKFIFRELLQNADDVKSTILVLRFEEDALYVANNGRAFTTSITDNQPSDFEKISRILGRHQAEDKEVVGHFGSGFQTVYALTNSPEVHSNGISGQMNPSLNMWADVKERVSPYISQNSKGVLFRFPWRDDKLAEEEINGEKVFEDPNYWPRWNKQARRGLFEDLTKYIGQSILCCQSITTIRLVWREQSNYEGFQVTRNFILRINDEAETDFEPIEGTVEQGYIRPKDWKDEWTDSFQSGSWEWVQEKQSFRYLIGRRNVASALGKRLYYGKKADGSYSVTSDINSLVKVLKRGDVHILFPLFDISSSEKAYLYSVIPLPKRSKNQFVFSGHFYPTEDRKDVDVEGNQGLNREWYQKVMLNVLQLYLLTFPIFLRRVKDLKVSEETRQRIILNSVPKTTLQEWMRPGRDESGWWEKEYEELVQSIISQPILFYGNDWASPTSAYWPQNEIEESVLRIMDAKVFSKDFIIHPSFEASLSKQLQDRKVTMTEFHELWNRFKNENQNDSGNLVYQQRLKNGRILDKEAVNSLISYCITREEVWKGTVYDAVVPGKDGILRSIRDYPIVPDQLNFMNEIVSDSMIIHDDFRFLELPKEDRTLNNFAVVSFINKIVEQDPSQFTNMDTRHHSMMSKILKTLVEEMDFTLSPAMKDLKFIPYKLGDAFFVGTPNIVIANNRKELISSSHIGESYQRDFIFGVQKIPVPGLTPEVAFKIKFISLVDCEDKSISKIEDRLFIVKLLEIQNKPTNFVRQFLSPSHGSLFEDSILREFLGTIDEKVIQRNKKAFQETLKIYFDKPKEENDLQPGDMSKVPCLYDSEGAWHNAGDFALEVYTELKLIGYKSLHEDLRWPKETLRALGVVDSPQSTKIVETIKALVLEKDRNREALSNIVVWLLTSEVPIDSRYKEVESLSWIPTTDGYYRYANEVIIPSDKNKSIMGDDFGGYLDFTLCSGYLKERALKLFKNQIGSNERLTSLGFEIAPELSDMLIVVAQSRKEGKEPPLGLFDALNESIDLKDERGSFNENYGYYINGKWIDSSEILLMNEKDVPAEILGALTVLPPNHKHNDYLRCDGARDTLSPDDLLSLLSEGRIEPSVGIWDKLGNFGQNIDETQKRKYGRFPIYPVDGRLVPPENIICIESIGKNPFLEEGQIGLYVIIGPNLTFRHGGVLKKLGARSDSELNGDELISLIKLKKEREGQLTVEKTQTILRLINRIRELDSGHPFVDQPLWPAEREGQLTWLEPRYCYIRDSPVAKHFEDALAFLCVGFDGEENVSLTEYAILSGSKRFSDCVKPTFPELGRSEHYEELTRILNELSKALGLRFKMVASSSGCFDWLRDADVLLHDDLSVHYSIPKLGKGPGMPCFRKIPEYAIVEEKDAKSVIHVRFGNIRVYDQLTNAIVEECLKRGFTDRSSEREELKILLYKLLTHRPIDWGDLIEGYKYPEEAMELYESAISTVEGGKGYIETKQALQEWYGCCQICGSKTPRGEWELGTLETLKSIISVRGGRYHGKREVYSRGNSLLLCPRHQVLYERGLVRFPEFENEKDVDLLIESIEKQINHYKGEGINNQSEIKKWRSEVFEAELDLFSARDSRLEAEKKSSWKQKNTAFTLEHLIDFLENMVEYYRDVKEHRHRTR